MNKDDYKKYLKKLNDMFNMKVMLIFKENQVANGGSVGNLIWLDLAQCDLEVLCHEFIHQLQVENGELKDMEILDDNNVRGIWHGKEYNGCYIESPWEIDAVWKAMELIERLK
jgi:hypothetical protein